MAQLPVTVSLLTGIYMHLSLINQVRLYNSRPACVILKRQNDSIVGFDVFSGD